MTVMLLACLLLRRLFLPLVLCFPDCSIRDPRLSCADVSCADAAESQMIRPITAARKTGCEATISDSITDKKTK
jgi:hypothetical protein